MLALPVIAKLALSEIIAIMELKLRALQGRTNTLPVRHRVWRVLLVRIAQLDVLILSYALADRLHLLMPRERRIATHVKVERSVLVVLRKFAQLGHMPWLDKQYVLHGNYIFIYAYITLVKHLFFDVGQSCRLLLFGRRKLPYCMP